MGKKSFMATLVLLSAGSCGLTFRWMLTQLTDTKAFQPRCQGMAIHSICHPFVQLSGCLQKASPEERTQRLQDRSSHLQHIFQSSPPLEEPLSSSAVDSTSIQIQSYGSFLGNYCFGTQTLCTAEWAKNLLLAFPLRFKPFETSKDIYIKNPKQNQKPKAKPHHRSIKKKTTNPNPTNNRKANGKVCSAPLPNFHPGNSASTKNELKSGDQTSLSSQTVSQGLDLLKVSSEIPNTLLGLQLCL